MRLKLPAWGRELRAIRERDEHPPRVWVLAGEHWGSRRPATAPSVGIGCDWRQGRTDWSPLAGLSAHIVDRGGLNLLDLGAELATVAAPVILHYRTADDLDQRLYGPRLQYDIIDLLWCERHRRALWSQALADDYESRKMIWYRAMAETMLQEAA